MNELILIVDDEPIIVLPGQMYLDREGSRVICAGDGNRPSKRWQAVVRP